jgi:hypothetical protein
MLETNHFVATTQSEEAKAAAEKSIGGNIAVMGHP